MGMGGQRHAPPALPPGKIRYILYRRLGGPQNRSGQVRKISPPPGFDARTVKPVASRYTDRAIPTPRQLRVEVSWDVMAHAQKPDFVFRRNGRVHLNRRGASVQSTTGSRGVRISGGNAGCTMFRGSVKGTGYPLHSPVSPSLPLPCVIVCNHISIAVYSAPCSELSQYS